VSKGRGQAAGADIENAGNLFGNVLLAELPALHRPPSLEAVPTCVPGPARR
jgi:hypothetical protein